MLVRVNLLNVFPYDSFKTVRTPEFFFLNIESILRFKVIRLTDIHRLDILPLNNNN